MMPLARYAERVRQQIGLLGVASLLALLTILAIWLGVLLPAQAALKQQAAELAWLQAQSRTSVARDQPLDDAQSLARFYSQFPAASELRSMVQRIHQIAVEQGIVLTTGEYKLTRDGNNARLVRYDIVFPVQANYANLRSFITAASRQFATLGLSEIHIKRESVNDSGAQIKLNYVLLMANEP